MLKAKVAFRPEVIERLKKKLEEERKNAHPQTLTVGIHEAEGSESKNDYHGDAGSATLSRIAAAHEFGIGVPERSWLRTWFDQNRSRLSKEMVVAFRAHREGDGNAVEEQGERWAEELREWIQQSEGGMRELEEATVREKTRAGLSSPATPLVATRQLVNAIKSMLGEAA